MPSSAVRPGTYRHFKGGLYEVYGVAERIDRHELLVIYRPLYGTRDLVARPVDEFAGLVVVDGREVRRFEYIDPPAPADPAQPGRDGSCYSFSLK